MGTATVWIKALSAWRALAAPQAPSQKRPLRDYEDLAQVNHALIPLLALGFASAIWVGWQAASIGPILLWCISCLSVGATIGFLFGIPRVGSQPRAATELASPGVKPPARPASNAEVLGGRPNTNLEEVSDWLTKIIVGLALVNLPTIELRIMAISRNAAASFSATPTASHISTASALVVGFSVIGFFCGYLYTRLFLQGAFIRSDLDLRQEQYLAVVAEELSQATPETPPATGQPSTPTLSDRASAERVAKAAPSGHPDAVLTPLRALAAEYEKLRQDMPFGLERTRKMSAIVSSMRRFALAAKPYIAQLAASDSPGEHLAAVVILQMSFDVDYIEWLANRLPEESAFIGYQAASCLLARAEVAGPPEQLRIRNAVEGVKGNIRPERERDALVEEILKATSPNT